jgi:hypothetical protein
LCVIILGILSAEENEIKISWPLVKRTRTEGPWDSRYWHRLLNQTTNFETCRNHTDKNGNFIFRGYLVLGRDPGIFGFSFIFSPLYVTLSLSGSPKMEIL